MNSVIRKLYAAAVVLAALASASYYLGARAAHAASNAQAECVMCFGAGDEWKIFGGLLLVVALAFAAAATMLWLRERKADQPPVSITS